jgi:hypothetical protein
MEKFFINLIEGSSIVPPENISVSLYASFPEAINIEWFKKEVCFETIFYKDSIEYIALFDYLGGLLEYKMNLPKNYMPEKIKSELEVLGEIMNAVMINKGNRITYEIIIRDKEFKRSLLLLNEWGDVLTEKKL